MASQFSILSGAAITSTGGCSIVGDVGASPIAGSAIGLTSAQVSGTIYTVDANGPAGSLTDTILLSSGKNDMMTAYVAAAGRTPTPVGPQLNPGVGNIGGMNLEPGLYKFTGTASITGSDLTLTGGSNDVWIFQCASDLQVGTGIQVILAGGARACNVYWQVGSSAVIQTFAVFKGTIIADQAITLMTSSVMEGRALAFTAGVVADGSSLTKTDFWSDAFDLGSGWRSLDWFGNYYVNGNGWLKHEDLGWMWSPSVSPTNVFLYTEDLGWLWTSNTFYPYMYRYSDGVWLWYLQGTGARWFYNYTTLSWESR
jgi:hypothetical protein